MADFPPGEQRSYIEAWSQLGEKCASSEWCIAVDVLPSDFHLGDVVNDALDHRCYF
jgi:hypothetical protein